jgi:RNA polymerase sigma factor (sigma-70 family)
MWATVRILSVVMSMSRQLAPEPNLPTNERDILRTHGGLVHKALRSFSRCKFPNVEYDDLVSVAQYGLLQAYRRYDPSKNIRFSTFAMNTIRGEILHCIRDCSGLRRSAHEADLKIHKARERLMAVLGRYPTDEEICQSVGITLDEYFDVQEAKSFRSPVSLDLVFVTNDGKGASTLGDLVPDPVTVRRESPSDTVWEYVDKLPVPQRDLIRIHYSDGVSQTELGKRAGITPEAVNARMRKALRQLKVLMTAG